MTYRPAHRQWGAEILADPDYAYKVWGYVLRGLVFEESGCWTSDTLRLDEKHTGYTFVSVHQQKRQAHAVVYLLTFGEPGQHLEFDHTCRNRACFNPWHVEAVTRSVNSSRGLGPQSNGNAQKTHCPEGHPYSGDNLGLARNGRNPEGKPWRFCKTCRGYDTQQVN